jgi:hypothetical protein
MLSLATIIFCSDLDNYVPILFVFFLFWELSTVSFVRCSSSLNDSGWM